MPRSESGTWNEHLGGGRHPWLFRGYCKSTSAPGEENPSRQMGRLEIVNTHSRRLRTPQDLSFGCRYSQRTLNQLGEDALSFQLVSRHLLECPACRAHRRRISKVDTALLKTLKQETPPFFEGRWETIRSNLNIPLESEEKSEKRPFRQVNIRLIAAVIGMAMTSGTS